MPVQTVIKVRRDTQANWGSTNPVLAAGEQGFVADTRYYKVGDGTSTWNALPFTNAGYADTAGTANSASSATNATNATNAINQWVVARNATGATIAKGVPVYVSGSNGTNILISKAGNTTEATSSKVLGLTYASIANNASNYVITEGLLSGINTSSAALGDSVWLGVDGALLFGLANKPVAPAHMVSLGVVTKVNGSTGEIFVKVQNGFELEELHDVLITSEADGDALVYEGASGLWKNKSLFASPTFTGNATFEDITLTDDASIIGTVTVRDDMVLTGETLTLGEVTNISSSQSPTAFLANDLANGFNSADSGSTHLNIYFASAGLKSSLSVGGTIIMDGTSRTIVSFTPATYATEVELSSAYSDADIQSITLDVTSTTITTDSTSLDSDVAAIATSHVAIGSSNILVSTATITSSSISFTGTSSAQAGDIVTMRSNDLSKISGVRYDGTPSSITYSATDGLWTIPGIPVREVTGYSLAIGQDSALNMLGANQSVMLGHQAGAYNDFVFGSVLSGYRAGASAVNNIQYSVGVGTSALEGANSSNANVAIGQNSSINLDGSYNTALGTSSLGFATSSDSVAVGSSALADSDGSYNVAIGSGAGQGVAGSNNVFIGYGVYSNGDGQLQIGNANVPGLPLIDGSFTDKKLSINGSLKFTEAAREKVYTTSAGFAGYAYYTQTNGAIQYITTNATGNGTVNIRPSADVTMDNWLAIGESVTLVLQITNGSTAYYPTAWQIDGSAVTPKWLGGTTPTGGNANAIDTYSLTITKTASATYTVFASVSKFA